ncbi:MAG: DUF4158 domain-containing protein [Oligoflexia bacterium]|nr:DUF4158 domain-containing protein [Oligoflexia bacterium]
MVKRLSKLKLLSKTKRLHILTSVEIEDLYLRPKLSADERTCLFELNQEEQKILSFDISTATKVDAIIRLGYFRQKQQFFQFDLSEVNDDVKHILERYFLPAVLDKKAIAREVKLSNQQWVLQITGYKFFDQNQHLPELINKAKKLCQLSTDPVFIFRELLTSVNHLKITRPGYSAFQKIISHALMSEQQRVSKTLKEHLSSEEKWQLFKLLEREDNFYAITSLKQQPKNFKPTAIRQEIRYYEQYNPLYKISKRVLPLLEISKIGIEYYASLVEHYTVRALSRTNPDQASLWLLCFISNRYRHMLDNLATMFIYTANQYQDDVKKQAEVLLLIHSLTPDEQKRAMAKLLRIYTDKTVNENQPFKTIKKFVYSNILPPEQINRVADELDHQEQQKIHQTQFTWQAVDEYANTYRPLLRTLLKVLVFEGPQHTTLQKAYHFLNGVFESEQPLSEIPFNKFPTQFINIKIFDFIFDSEKKIIDTDRYEYECYQQLATHLNDRSLFLRESINYQSLTDELLPEW